MKIQEIKPRIFQINFPNQYFLTASFMRMQEFYESPFDSIRGKYFTHEQYMDLYAKKYEKFDYFTAWNGFNVPGKVVNQFTQLFHVIKNDLNIKETKLIEAIWKARKTDFFSYLNDDKYYIIANNAKSKNKKGYYKHELAHGLYSTNKRYRKEMDIALTGLCDDNDSFYRELRKCLLKKGYTKHVIMDEIQAYLSEAPKKYFVNKLGIKKSTKIPSRRFKKIIAKYL